ncbi:DUF4148 domain-containing protein [Burkholderia sp. BE17]|uniref:DUF4148 domain-containing protein n=1 Tax=Burkholderia sp. BE17 TaxID=2656644 RepID=UPI00128D8EDB|nr:DUF4148 domain-containing protein [Burkholderia sp. BE17]MPV68377.1 DUF4148 domain-containing protein [Burkholderia sp. BE17]
MATVLTLRSIRVAAVAVSAGFVVSVHAQDPGAAPSGAQSPDVEATSERASPASAPTSGNSDDGKTRAQVKRELEQARRVGEMGRITRFFGGGS